MAALRKKVSPFILRRMKKDVLSELPPISEIVYHCHLSDVQRSRDFYRALLDLPILDESPSSCFLGLGDGNFLSLFQGNPGLNHYCIGIEDYEVDRVMTELQRQGLEPRRHAGTNRAYFDDPDGLEVQLAVAGHQDVQL